VTLVGCILTIFFVVVLSSIFCCVEMSTRTIVNYFYCDS